MDRDMPASEAPVPVARQHSDDGERLRSTLLERIADSVARYPDNSAVVDQERQLTYRELWDQSFHIAQNLRKLAPGKGERIAIEAPHGVPAILAILATLRAGHVYVPIGSSAGIEWNRRVVEHAGAKLVLCWDAGKPDEGYGDAATVTVPELLERPVSGELASLPVRDHADLFCLTYTSGSTGQPKGVANCDALALISALEYMRLARIEQTSRVSQLTPVTFGNSTHEIFGSLMSGAGLYAYELARRGVQELPLWLQDNRISTLICVPSLLRRLRGDTTNRVVSPTIETVVAGAEPMYSRDLELIARSFPKAQRFVHTMGATETKFTRALVVDRPFQVKDDILPVGYPVAGVEISVVDAAGDPMPAGEAGELVFRSPYLATGYWNDTELSAKHFSTDPDLPDIHVFHSNDLGYLRPDGCLVLLGRKDSEVKIAGRRIDLAEIDSAMHKLEPVRDAVTTVVSSRRGDAQLYAFLVLEAGHALTVADLHEALSTSLDAYMVPAKFFELAELPLTSTGKLDRSRLSPETATALPLGTRYKAPATRRQRVLCDMFAQVLRRERVGAEDNFFFCGGDSLQAADLIARVNGLYGVELDISQLISAPTPKDLDSLLEKGGGSGTSPVQDIGRPVVLRESGMGGELAPFFLFPGGKADDVTLYLIYGRLVPHLDPGRGVYAYAIPAESNEAPDLVQVAAEAISKSIDEIAGDRVAQLVGFCTGAILAYEVALRLRAVHNADVDLVFVDPFYPSGHLGWRLWRINSTLGKYRDFASEFFNRAVVHLRSVNMRHPLQGFRHLVSKLALARQMFAPYAEMIQHSGGGSARLARALSVHRPDPGSGTAGLDVVNIIVCEDEKSRKRSQRWIDGHGLRANYRQVPGDHRTHIRQHVGAVARAITEMTKR